mmetsp:Transcript_39808/g.113518  ORF Transcript_39808/g.113518 Transcript_39808/m.113518 type:complete len:350 (-) Transcript_39808:588-1637(-)
MAHPSITAYTFNAQASPSWIYLRSKQALQPALRLCQPVAVCGLDVSRVVPLAVLAPERPPLVSRHPARHLHLTLIVQEHQPLTIATIITTVPSVTAPLRPLLVVLDLSSGDLLCDLWRHLGLCCGTGAYTPGAGQLDLEGSRKVEGIVIGRTTGIGTTRQVCESLLVEPFGGVLDEHFEVLRVVVCDKGKADHLAGHQFARAPAAQPPHLGVLRRVARDIHRHTHQHIQPMARILGLDEPHSDASFEHRAPDGRGDFADGSPVWVREDAAAGEYVSVGEEAHPPVGGPLGQLHKQLLPAEHHVPTHLVLVQQPSQRRVHGRDQWRDVHSCPRQPCLHSQHVQGEQTSWG